MALTLAGNGTISGADWGASGGGLTKITTQSFSAVSAVNVNNCFTSTYENYLVVVNAPTFSATGAALYARLRASSTDATTAYYWGEHSILYSTGVGTSGAATNAGQWQIGYTDASGPVSCNVTIYAPNLVEKTRYENQHAGESRTAARGGYHNTASAYDGFTIYPSSGTITGTLTVYGYTK